LLLKANANRVYGGAALDLARAEVASFDRNVLGGIVQSARREAFGGVDYLVLDTTADLAGVPLQALSNLSSLHALFGVEGELLRPITIAPRAVMDEDVTTIQRYSGKTNEGFTHLLVNVALAESEAFARLLAGDRRAGGARRSTAPSSTAWTPTASSSTSGTSRRTPRSSSPG
jgi:hypothetical protein